MKEESGGKPSTPSALEGRLSSGGTTSLAATSSFDWAKIKVSTSVCPAIPQHYRFAVKDAVDLPLGDGLPWMVMFMHLSAAMHAHDRDQKAGPNTPPLPACSRALCGGVLQCASATADGYRREPGRE